MGQFLPKPAHQRRKHARARLAALREGPWPFEKLVKSLRHCSPISLKFAQKPLLFYFFTIRVPDRAQVEHLDGATCTRRR